MEVAAGSSQGGIGGSVAVVAGEAKGGDADARGGHIEVRAGRSALGMGGAVVISSGKSEALSSGEVVVLDVREGSSAERAGIGKGDRIVSIDGTFISGRGLDGIEVSSMIAGQQGSSVLLQLISTQGRES